MINNIHKALSRREFIFLMGAIMATHALAIDAILPALSQISAEFGLSNDNDRQYIVTSLFVGYAIGVIIYGIVSDSYGEGMLCSSASWTENDHCIMDRV